MTYLLDVNALLSLLFSNHEFHDRMEQWIEAGRGKKAFAIATCPVTELGFIRIASGVPFFGIDISGARSLLTRFKHNKALAPRFIPDDLSASELPGWVSKSAHTTDGYLSRLAISHGFLLATLDEGIPDAFLIPR